MESDPTMTAQIGLQGKKTFVEYMSDFNKYGYTLMSLVLGYDLGIFEVLKNAGKPLNSTEIADLANLKER